MNKTEVINRVIKIYLKEKTKMDIKERICKCLEEDGIELSNEGDLINVESINFISAIVSIEQEFDIEFPDNYLLFDTMSNIGDIEQIVKSLMNMNSIQNLI